MKILHISSEVAPFSKTGGLADVAGALPRALAGLGLEVAVVTPRYRIDADRFGLAKRLREVWVPLGKHEFAVRIYEGRLPAPRGEVKLWFIDHELFDRAGLYNDNGQDYPDNGVRFALLSRAADIVARTFGFYADVIHAHDWQSSLALLFCKRDPERAAVAATVLTIHNLAFRGLFPDALADEIGVPRELLTPDGIEFYGQMSYLKAGIQSADRITTVSPRYAHEIETPEFGYGFEGLLKEKADRLVGILNGIDYDVWNPRRDPAVAHPYDLEEPAHKRHNKTALQRLVGLPDRPRVPLTGAVSRLSDQKGFDLIAGALETLLGERDMQVVILGSGDAALEERLRQLAATFPTKLAVRTGYDEGLAHRIYAGSDLFVMPSRYEPCGLGQLYALRYGAVPIVRATGGLDDTVVDYDPRSRTGSGFKFVPATVEGLGGAWRRALAAYASDEGWPDLVRRAMKQDFSWGASARSYRGLYQSLARGR